MKQDNGTTDIIYKFIQTYQENNRKSPTICEIASGCFVSVGTVIRHLDKLEIMRRIEREPNQARSIIILTEDDKNFPDH